MTEQESKVDKILDYLSQSKADISGIKKELDFAHNIRERHDALLSDISRRMAVVETKLENIPADRIRKGEEHDAYLDGIEMGVEKKNETSIAKNANNIAKTAVIASIVHGLIAFASILISAGVINV